MTMERTRESVERTCRVCLASKPIEDFDFWSKADGKRRHQCRPCWKQKRREYQDANREHCRKLWREKSREWYRRDPKAAGASSRKWKEENKERVAARTKRWSRLNTEKMRKYYTSYRRQWRKNNPERSRELWKKWASKNKALLLAAANRRRARLRKARIGDEKAILGFYKYVRSGARLRCFYCKKVVRKADRHVDHIIPLSRGGMHCVSNLCCACSNCNLRKNTKTGEEFTGQLNLLGRDETP